MSKLCLCKDFAACFENRQRKFQRFFLFLILVELVFRKSIFSYINLKVIPHSAFTRQKSLDKNVEAKGISNTLIFWHLNATFSVCKFTICRSIASWYYRLPTSSAFLTRLSLHIVLRNVNPLIYSYLRILAEPRGHLLLTLLKANFIIAKIFFYYLTF